MRRKSTRRDDPKLTRTNKKKENKPTKTVFQWLPRRSVGPFLKAARTLAKYDQTNGHKKGDGAGQRWRFPPESVYRGKKKARKEAVSSLRSITSPVDALAASTLRTPLSRQISGTLPHQPPSRALPTVLLTGNFWDDKPGADSPELRFGFIPPLSSLVSLP